MGSWKQWRQGVMGVMELEVENFKILIENEWK